MKYLILIFAIGLTLWAAPVLATETPATPLSPADMEMLTRLEKEHPVDTVKAGDFSPESARQAFIIQIATLAASILGAGMLLSGLAIAWRRSRLRTPDIVPAGNADRRAATRYAMKSETSTITLHTPFGEIKASPVDISEGGMQIIMQEEQPLSSDSSFGPIPEKIKLSLARAGEQGSRLLDTIPCMICWARKDRLGLKFESNITLDDFFAQRIAVPVPV